MENLTILRAITFYFLFSSLLLAEKLLIASSKHFEIWCGRNDTPICQQEKTLKPNSQKIANVLDEIKAWFGSLGFKARSMLRYNLTTKKATLCFKKNGFGYFIES